MDKLELKKIIRNSGLSREEFANKLKISIFTLNCWEYRKSGIPENKKLLIESVFNPYLGTVVGQMALKKEGVEVSMDEVFHFIIKNEEYIFKNHKLFRLWISEKIYKGMAELITTLRSEKTRNNSK